MIGTGEVIWAFKAGAGFFSSPTYHDGVIFAGGNDDKLYAVDADTGTLKWTFQAGEARGFGGGAGAGGGRGSADRRATGRVPPLQSSQ